MLPIRLRREREAMGEPRFLPAGPSADSTTVGRRVQDPWGQEGRAGLQGHSLTQGQSSVRCPCEAWVLKKEKVGEEARTEAGRDHFLLPDPL